MKPSTQHIWNPDTGITDLEKPWQELAASDIPGIKSIWQTQRERLAGSDTLTRFTERLSREWAIETGIIENLYDIDRGVTQTLIEQGFQANLLTHGSTNKPTAYVLNLLNDQREALDGVFDFVARRRELSTSYIKELHAGLLRSQDTTEAVDASGNHIDVTLIKGEWKSHPNYPTRDGVLFAYCPPEQVASEMDRLVKMHQQHLADGVSADVEAAWLHHRFSQIHPFQDGNGRVCRALASLVLIQAGLFPLVVTRDHRTQYLDALEAADRGDLSKLIKLFAKLQTNQALKAIATAENVITAADDVATLLAGLVRTKRENSSAEASNYNRVFEHSAILEQDTLEQMEFIKPKLEQFIANRGIVANTYVCRSDREKQHWYRGQIIENARQNYHYYANLNEGRYREWIALRAYWERKAHLVYAFHGTGSDFTGALVCAPFLEFKDDDEDGSPRTTLFPVSEDLFVFHHTEPIELLRRRFEEWLNQSLMIAIKQFANGC
jgi:Fic family protein